MRSRGTGQEYPVNRVKLSAARHRPRRFIQAQLTRTLITKPDEYVRRVGPEERTDLARHLHRRVDAQPLQSLKVKCAIVVIALGAFIPVNTLPLTIRLPSHDAHHFPRRLARTQNCN